MDVCIVNFGLVVIIKLLTICPHGHMGVNYRHNLVLRGTCLAAESYFVYQTWRNGYTKWQQNKARLHVQVSKPNSLHPTNEIGYVWCLYKVV